MKKIPFWVVPLGLTIAFWVAMCLQPAFSQSWRGYPYAPSGSSLVFPRDEGSHPGSKTEWWYFNFHLTEKQSGHRMAAMVTYFNSQIKLFNLTDETTGQFFPHSQLGRLNSGTGYLHLRHTVPANPLPDELFTLEKGGMLEPFQYFLNAFSKDFHLKLFLNATKPPLLISGDGYLPVGTSGSTFYYSLPLLTAKGVLTANGQTDSINGIGWMDHQWGDFFITPTSRESYEWFSVQLDDNRQIVFWDIFTAQNRIPADEAHKMCTLSFRDGSQDTSLSFKIRRLRFWKSPDNGLTFSHKWEFVDTRHGIDLILRPTVKNQLANVLGAMPFYEGSCTVSGTWAGKQVQGVGFAELLHRYQAPRIQVEGISPGSVVEGVLRVSWRVENPDDGRPLLFDLFLTDDSTGSTRRVARALQDTVAVISKANFPDGLAYRLKVAAYTPDSTLLGEAVSPRFAWITAPCGAVEIAHPFPNPFQTDITIPIFVRMASSRQTLPVALEIDDILGRRVWQKKSAALSAGIHFFHWNGKTHSGQNLPAGIYFVRLGGALQVAKEKILKLR